MAADRPPQLFDVNDVRAHRISPGDTVRLAPLRRPDEVYGASVFLEIWDPGGAQPPNAHPDSVETFLFLSGHGRAYCDDTVLDVRAGQFLVLPPRSIHRIENTGRRRLYTITTMSPDDGFADLVGRGESAALDAEDRAILVQATDTAAS